MRIKRTIQLMGIVAIMAWVSPSDVYSQPPQQGQRGQGQGQRGQGQGQRGQGQFGQGQGGQRGQGQLGQGQGGQRGQGQGQGQRGQGQQGGGQGNAQQGGQQAERIAPIVRALDLNGDRTISRDEIAQAYQSLKALDANGDGIIATYEFRAQGAPSDPGGGPPQGPPQGGPGGAGQGRGPGGPGAQGGGQGRGPGGPGAQGGGPGRGPGGPGAQGGGPGRGPGGPGAQGGGQGRGPGGPGAQGGGPGRGPGGPGAQGGGQGRGPGAQGGQGQRRPDLGQNHGGGSTAAAVARVLESTPAKEVNPRDMPDRPRDIRFRNSIKLGAALPDDVEIYDINQNRIPLNKLFRNRYTVVVSGCLTCPAFLNAYGEIEAVYNDYKGKADFYFLYHVLAHPENRGFIQPMTIDERFMHIAEAKRSLQTKVPWIADTMENELKERYVFASNPEFIFAPDGKVVHREPWSRGTSIRTQLEKLVGPSARMTSVESLNLPKIERVSEGDRSGEVKRVQVQGMAAPLKFETKTSEHSWYAKMRPEADQRLVRSGTGQMYLGFHLDPIHQVQWNNLADPLKFELTGPAGVQVSPASGEGARLKSQTDGDPREFLVDVANWSADQPLQLAVSYVACSKADNSCIPVRQEYTIHLVNDLAAGRVNGRTHMAGGAAGPGGQGGQARGGQGGRGPGGGGGRGPGGQGRGQGR